MKKFIVVALCLMAVVGCTTIGHVEPPKDWPLLNVKEHFVSEFAMRERCSKYTGLFMSPMACMEFDFNARTCDLWFSAEYPPTAGMREHELMHCAGHDHLGDSTLRDAWNNYKINVLGQAVGNALSRY